ncbi:MAG: N-acetylmuramoyl-L-alanine amidase [Elusimicrobiota bacterium]|jgi:N-acetylmuramoyl-L-alanine amidase
MTRTPPPARRTLSSLQALCGVLAAAFILLLAAAGNGGCEDVQVVKSGKLWGSVSAYRVDETYYLEAKDAGRVYGARVDYFGVSGKVTLSLHGRKAVLIPESAQAAVGEQTVELPEKVLLRNGKAMVPIAFLLSEAFSEAAGCDTQFNAKTRLLTVDQRSSVGPLRWFTYPDHTRVVLEFKEDLAYKSERRGLRALEVSIPRGSIEWSEKTEIGDGVVEGVTLRQESRQARMTVQFEKDSPRWTLKEYPAPRRLVLDVAREGAPFLSAAQPREAPRLEAGAPADAADEAPSAVPAAGAVALAAAPLATPAVTAAAAAPAAVPSAGLSAEGTAREENGSRAAKTAKPARKRIRIAVDAGHGGKDSGAPGLRGVYEKDINLSVARELSRLLEEEGLFDVFLTRQTDVFLPLSDRSRLSNEWGADLFVSLHCNAHPSRAENGFEIYFLSERASDPEAERLAEFENSVLALEGKGEVEDEAAEVLYQLARTEFINDASELSGVMEKTLKKRVELADRGVKQASFYVLRGANAPAVLVEMGYVTNPQDETKLESKKFRRKLAEGIYAGLLDFARRKDWLKPEGRP